MKRQKCTYTKQSAICSNCHWESAGSAPKHLCQVWSRTRVTAWPSCRGYPLDLLGGHEIFWQGLRERWWSQRRPSCTPDNASNRIRRLGTKTSASSWPFPEKTDRGQTCVKWSNMQKAWIPWNYINQLCYLSTKPHSHPAGRISDFFFREKNKNGAINSLIRYFQNICTWKIR